jgi:hypothetical protein
MMTLVARTLTDQDYSERPWPEPGTTRTSYLLPQVPTELAPVVLRLRELLDLREAWDSYGPRRDRPVAARAALRILVSTGWTGPLPSVAPTSLGGVLLEWGNDVDGVEIECGPEGFVTVLTDIRGQMEEWTATGPDDPRLTEALAWAEKLA